MKLKLMCAVALSLVSVASAQVIGGKTSMGTTDVGSSPANTPPCGSVMSHSVPPAIPGGVGFDGTHVWLGGFFSAPLLWKIDPASGAVVGTLPAPDLHIGGIVCVDDTIWVCAEQTAMIYQLDSTSGAVLNAFPSPTIGDDDPNGAGLAWDGLALWHADYRQNVVYRLDPVTGAILWTIPAPTIGPSGLSYVDGKLVVASFYNKVVYQVDPTNGDQASRCTAPFSFPWGIAVDEVGSLWVSTGNNNRIRLAPTDFDVSRYCFGDGSATPCPCGNTGQVGAGCANSTGLGAALDSSGAPSLTSDSLVLHAIGLVPGQPALLFAGANAVNGGQGNHFGDGLRCAGGGVVRLGVNAADANGISSWGAGLLQAGWQAGETRRFQAWYRDPVGSTCGASFNLSNGVAQVIEP